MGAFDNVMLRLDQGVTGALGEWNSYSTALATLLVLVVSYSLFTRREPDTHPMLLARQSLASAVRHERESAVYRSHGAPHGMGLVTGLNVRAPGESRWSRGRDGDLRDIWRRAVEGAPDDDGAGKGSRPKGKLLTVLGREQVIEESFENVSRQINLIGRHLAHHGAIRVAIYLPNSIEYLATLFACSFYGLTAILLPFDEPEETVVSTLRRSAADAVVTAPGMFPFDTVVRSYPALRQLIWVVDEGSRHMDWNEVPKGMGGAVNVATWQEILADGPADAGYELPASNSADEAKNIITFWKTGKPGQLEEMVRFTHGHLVAGVAAQLAAIPQSQRLTPADLFLPAAPLSHAYTLVLTLAALYSNASVALNSAAARAPDLAAATTGISPTVIVATPRALANTHAAAIRGRMASSVVRVSHWLQTRALVRDGVMPAAGLLSRTADAVLRPELGIEPGKLRLVFVAERAGTSQPTTASARPDGGDDEDVQPQLSSRVLSDLRVCLGARIVYALTAAKVAGAVAQTAIYDYRVFGDANDGRATHFGAPTTATEVFLRDTKQHRTTDEVQEGEICVRGPCVSGGEASLGVVGRILSDNTIAYI